MYIIKITKTFDTQHIIKVLQVPILNVPLELQVGTCNLYMLYNTMDGSIYYSRACYQVGMHFQNFQATWYIAPVQKLGTWW